MMRVRREDAIRAEAAQVQSRVLEPMRLDEIGRYQHLVIESVDRAVQVSLVVVNLDRCNCAYRLQMSECRAYPGRKSAIQAFQLIPLAGVPAVGVRDRDTNLASVRAFVGNYFG